MADRLVAIHQPNFLPWLGWWDKLARADTLVVLDDVQFQKGGGRKGGNWTNRTQLLVNGDVAWATVPVVRSYEGVRPILEIEINEDRPWREKLLKTIQHSYGRAPEFDSVISVIEPLLRNPTSKLVEYNAAALHAIAERLGIDPSRMVRASNVGAAGQGTERLIELVKSVGGDSYLSGGGAGGYEDRDAFAEAGVEVVEQEFSPEAYPQVGEGFTPGLSVVDALMSCGFEGTRALVGRR